jgi:hypothetical protein
LELPYIVHNLPKGARFKEREYMNRFKTDMVILPRLLDPNILIPADVTSAAVAGAGIKVPLDITDAQSILLHLNSTYATGQVGRLCRLHL